jgi:predicted nucleic acid-binding protein
MTQDAKYNTAKLSEEQLYYAIQRLCHFVPLDSTDKLCYALQEFLIQHAMASVGMNPQRPLEVRDSVKKLFGLDFEQREIEIRLKRLLEAKKVACTKGKYWLDYHVCLNLRQAVKNCEDYEKKVIDDWLKSVENKYPLLSQEDLQRLKNDLKIFVAKIFVMHGAKCATLIYSKQEKTEEFVDNWKADLSDILPEYPALNTIRSTELPGFFIDAKGEQMKYIAELLDSSFLLHVIQIDKDCTALIKKFLKGCLLYLDTNVLFALLDIDTPREAVAVKRLIGISRQLGYTLVISTRTAEEFRYTLKNAEKHLQKNPNIPKNLARILANHTKGGFIPAYWRKHDETSISLEDFIGTYRHFEELLAKYEIEIRDDFCEEVQEDPELGTQIDLLYASADPVILDKDVAEHDAFHRLLIRKLRGGKAHTFSDASAWFLTLDKKLNHYDSFARFSEKDKDLSDVPFCILCDDWLQLVRPLLPRTDDYDKTFIELLSSPFLRSYRDVPPELAGKIIGRITHYKNFSPEVAAKMLTDSLFIQRLEIIHTEENQKEVIDNEIVATADEFRIERDYYKKQVEKASKTIKATEEEKKRIAEENKIIKIELGKKQSDFVNEEVKNIKIQDKFKKELKDIHTAHNSLVKYLKWGVTSAIWISIAAALIVILWSGLERGIKSLVLGVAVFGSVLTLAIPLGWRKTLKIHTVVGAFASIIAAIVYLGIVY